jgi:MoaA/NifB/PqqE/SkfB family radical SAM enzyme
MAWLAGPSGSRARNHRNRSNAVRASVTSTSTDLAVAGETLLATGRRAEARRLLSRALETDAGDVKAATSLARLLVAEGNLHSAAQIIGAAMARAPFDLGFSSLQREIAIALYNAYLWEDAEPWLERAVSLEPWDQALASAYTRARRPAYLKPEVFDPQLGRTLHRYAAREGDTYIFVVDIVGTCNLRCPTCPVGNSPRRPRGFMGLDMFERIVAKIGRESPVPHPQINLYNWGEPLLHPDLPAMISLLRGAGMRSCLSTNLNIKRGLEAAIAAAPDELKISLSGFSPETYSRAHARGKIDLVKANMRLVREYADRHRVTTKIWVGHHIYKSNQNEMEQVRQFCETLGFRYCPIRAFYMPLERVLEVLQGQPNPRDNGILEDLIRSPAEQQRAAAAQRSGCFDCELRFNQTVINHDGTVALCCTVYDESNMLGVSYLDEDFAAIEKRKYSHPFCQTCFRNHLEYAPSELALVEKAHV